MSRLSDYPKVSEATIDLLRRIDAGESVFGHERAWVEVHAKPHWVNPGWGLTPAGRELIGKHAPAVLTRNGVVRIGNAEPHKLLDPQAHVLQALIELDGAASKQKLIDRSGVSDAHKKVAELAELFPGHVFRPPGGKKGQGGYKTTIVLADE